MDLQDGHTTNSFQVHPEHIPKDKRHQKSPFLCAIAKSKQQETSVKHFHEICK